MSGKLHGLSRQVMSRWAVASRGGSLGVKQLALKGPVRCEASHQAGASQAAIAKVLGIPVGTGNSRMCG